MTKTVLLPIICLLAEAYLILQALRIVALG